MRRFIGASHLDIQAQPDGRQPSARYCSTTSAGIRPRLLISIPLACGEARIPLGSASGGRRARARR